MKHKIIGKPLRNQQYLLVEVELLPENDIEKDSIKQVELVEANEAQRGMIESYLMSCLKNQYSVLSVSFHKGTHFILKVSSIL